MFERFTDRSRKVMALANQEAQRHNHAYIGPEHILLGLIREGSGVAINVLKDLHVNPQKVLAEVERRVERHETGVACGKLPQTPEAKKVVEFAIAEARRLDHNYVGTEHLLLGLLDQQGTIAWDVLTALGVDCDAARDETRLLLGIGDAEAAEAASRAGWDENADEVGRQMYQRHPSLAATLRTVLNHLPPRERITPARLVLALVASDPALSQRLAPLMDQIRAACEDSAQ